MALDRRDVLLGFLGCAAALPGSAEAAENAGVVDSLSGAAFATTTQSRRDLAPAAPVFVGDVVGTGQSARLAMKLGRDTLLRLGAEARVTIDRFIIGRGGVITLGLGAMTFDRPEGARPAAFQVRSPFGAIAVRGTHFYAGPSQNVFGVFVARGRVAVSAAGRTVVLRDGEGTNILTPGGRPSDPARWGDGRVAAALGAVG